MLWNARFTCMCLPDFRWWIIFQNDRCWAYNDCCQGKCLWFMSFVSLRKFGNLSPPEDLVAKQGQRLWRTISLLINTTNANCRKTARQVIFSFWQVNIIPISGIMYRTSPVIILNKPIQGKARPLRFTWVSCWPCPGLFPNNDVRCVHYPLLITLLCMRFFDWCLNNCFNISYWCMLLCVLSSRWRSLTSGRSVCTWRWWCAESSSLRGSTRWTTGITMATSVWSWLGRYQNNAPSYYASYRTTL